MAGEVDGIRGEELMGCGGRLVEIKKPYDRGNVLIIRLLCGFRDVICREKGWNEALFLNLLP